MDSCKYHEPSISIRSKDFGIELFFSVIITEKKKKNVILLVSEIMDMYDKELTCCRISSTEENSSTPRSLQA